MGDRDFPNQVWKASPQQVTQNVLGRYRHTGPGFWLAAGILALLFLAGVSGLVIRFRGGFEDRAAWGYYAATFAFLLTTVQAAPLVSAGLRLTKAHWRRPISRPSELFAMVGFLSILLFAPLLKLVPPVQGRRSIWFEWPVGAPYVWDTLAMAALVFTGLAFLWVASWPELVGVRDQAMGWRSKLVAAFLRPWKSMGRQWRLLKGGVVSLSAFYFIAFIFTHTLFSADFAMGMVPGWQSAIFPAYHTLTGVQGGVATVLVTMALFRWLGYRPYFLRDHFWALARILLALSLLGIYFWWAEFLTFWYGRTPVEQTRLQLLMVGPYMYVFLTGFFLSFLMPLLALMWNPIRQSILGPTIVAAGVLVGLFLDRIRIYVAAFSAAQVGLHPIESIPPVHYPDAADILMMVGLPAGAILIYLLVTRLVPPIALWEVKEGILLRVTRRYLSREVVSLGKPD